MKKQILILSVALLAPFIHAQHQKFILSVSPLLSDSIRSGFMHFNTPNQIQMGKTYEAYKQTTPDPKNDMLKISDHIDPLTQTHHISYMQTCMGIPVEGAGMIEHFDANQSLLMINAKFAEDIMDSHIPAVGPEKAISQLILQLKQNKDLQFAWEYPDWEEDLKIEENNPNATYYPTAELIYAIDTAKNMQLLIDGNRYALAYKIGIVTIHDDIDMTYYYVDAHNGNILKSKSTRVYNGPAHIQKYGTRIIDTQWYGGTVQAHILKAGDNGRNIHTKKNPSGITPWGLLPNVKDEDDNWDNSKIVETSAHYFTSLTWDYFKQYFFRNGLNNQGKILKVKTGLDAMNAFYIDLLGQDILNFGKNAFFNFGEDPTIVGHEYTHGIINKSSNLNHEYESGSLNESFSDIFGVMMKAHMLENGFTNWLVGDSSLNMPVRSLKNPKQYGFHWSGSGNNYSLGQPDTYGGQYYCQDCPVDNGGSHINSSIQNKWFYLLSEGEVGVNDNNHTYQVEGIGKNKAANIAYISMTSILLPSSIYTDAREASIFAAKLLYGECSKEYQSTRDAWYAVGVGSADNCSYTLAQQEHKNLSIVVFPNPSKYETTITANESWNQLKVYDITGRLIFHNKDANNTFKLQTQDWRSGIYTIQLESKGKTYTQKLIVQ